MTISLEAVKENQMKMIVRCNKNGHRVDKKKYSWDSDYS